MRAVKINQWENNQNQRLVRNFYRKLKQKLQQKRRRNKRFRVSMKFIWSGPESAMKKTLTRQPLKLSTERRRELEQLQDNWEQKRVRNLYLSVAVTWKPTNWEQSKEWHREKEKKKVDWLRRQIERVTGCKEKEKKRLRDRWRGEGMGKPIGRRR